MFIRFDMIHERDRQTHRQTPHDGIGRAYASHRAAKIVNSSCPAVAELLVLAVMAMSREVNTILTSYLLC